MPERGRPAASSGNAYHDVRVAICLIDLLDSVTVTSVAVETLDEIDDVVVQCSDGTTRYEQVKERAPSGRWTAQRLIDEGVLRQFLRQHRVDPNGEFVLFTGSDASDFREVVERARNASTNHPNDEPGRQAASAEWQRRLAGRRSFVDQILSRIPTVDGEHGEHTVTWQDLHAVLARVQVLARTIHGDRDLAPGRRHRNRTRSRTTGNEQWAAAGTSQPRVAGWLSAEWT